MSPSQDDEDDLGFTFPATPSELRKIPTDELAKITRKLSYANQYTASNMVEQEVRFRLVAALIDFKRAADRSSAVLICLTGVLVVLTIAIVVLTYQLL